MTLTASPRAPLSSLAAALFAAVAIVAGSGCGGSGTPVAPPVGSLTGTWQFTITGDPACEDDGDSFTMTLVHDEFGLIGTACLEEEDEGFFRLTFDVVIAEDATFTGTVTDCFTHSTAGCSDTDGITCETLRVEGQVQGGHLQGSFAPADPEEDCPAGTFSATRLP